MNLSTDEGRARTRPGDGDPQPSSQGGETCSFYGANHPRLLTGEAPELTLNLDLNSGLSLVIDHWPHRTAFLEIACPKGGRAVAFIEGDVIRQVGQCLHSLYLAAICSTANEGSVHVFSAAYCYPDNDEPRPS